MKGLLLCTLCLCMCVEERFCGCCCCNLICGHEKIIFECLGDFEMKRFTLVTLSLLLDLMLDTRSRQRKKYGTLCATKDADNVFPRLKKRCRSHDVPTSLHMPQIAGRFGRHFYFVGFGMMLIV